MGTRTADFCIPLRALAVNRSIRGRGMSHGDEVCNEAPSMDAQWDWWKSSLCSHGPSRWIQATTTSDRQFALLMSNEVDYK